MSGGCGAGGACDSGAASASSPPMSISTSMERWESADIADMDDSM